LSPEPVSKVVLFRGGLFFYKERGTFMAHVCLQAEECRVFIKNGQLRFQARRRNKNKEVEEQVTISFPKEMVCYFTKVEDLDKEKLIIKNANRIRNFLI